MVEKICPKCGGDQKHNQIILAMPKLDEIDSLGNFYKIMGDQTRLKILMTLEHGSLCVSDIACILDMSLSAISHQLKVLKDAKLVKYNKVGKIVYYELDDNHIKKILDMGLEHIRE